MIRLFISTLQPNAVRDHIQVYQCFLSVKTTTIGEITAVGESIRLAVCCTKLKMGGFALDKGEI